MAMLIVTLIMTLITHYWDNYVDNNDANQDDSNYTNYDVLMMINYARQLFTLITPTMTAIRST